MVPLAVLPSANGLDISRNDVFTVVRPEYVLVPLSRRFPVPVLVIPAPASPLMTAEINRSGLAV